MKATTVTPGMTARVPSARRWPPTTGAGPDSTSTLKRTSSSARGATGALYCACLALLEPGDEVILFEPYYSYHESTLIATEAVPVFVPTNPPDWSFSMDALGGGR